MQIIVKGLLLCVTACSLLLANSYSHAVDVDSLEFNHGIAIFGTLKYPADFAHFDYLNPDAPRGGEIILSHPFSFDSLAARPLGESGAPNGYHLQNDPLVVRSGDVVQVLERARRQFGIDGLWSHEETGNGWTYQRDKRVGAWARQHGIAWTEIPQFGVTRRLRSRNQNP